MRARETASRAAALAGDDSNPHNLVETTYDLLFSRKPSPQETEMALDHLESQQQLYAKANATPDEASDKSLANLVHMLISSNEFLYVD